MEEIQHISQRENWATFLATLSQAKSESKRWDPGCSNVVVYAKLAFSKLTY